MMNIIASSSLCDRVGIQLVTYSREDGSMSNDDGFCSQCGSILDPITKRCHQCETEYLSQDDRDMIFDEDLDDLS